MKQPEITTCCHRFGLPFVSSAALTANMWCLTSMTKQDRMLCAPAESFSWCNLKPGCKDVTTVQAMQQGTDIVALVPPNVEPFNVAMMFGGGTIAG